MNSISVNKMAFNKCLIDLQRCYFNFKLSLEATVCGSLGEKALSVFLSVFAWWFVHFHRAGGQRAGQPLQVSQFERQEDEADSMFDVHRALWVQEVMRRPIPNVFLKPSSHRLVHPAKDTDEEDKEEEDGKGKMCDLDPHTWLWSRGSRSVCRFQTVEVCRSCRPLRTDDSGRGGAWSPQ